MPCKGTYLLQNNTKVCKAGAFLDHRIITSQSAKHSVCSHLGLATSDIQGICERALDKISTESFTVTVVWLYLRTCMVICYTWCYIFMSKLTLYTRPYEPREYQ